MYNADLFNVLVGLYTTTKNQIRQLYETQVTDLKDDNEFEENISIIDTTKISISRKIKSNTIDDCRIQ